MSPLDNIFPLSKELLENGLQLTIKMRFDQDYCDEDQMHMWDLVISDGWRAVSFEEMPTIEEVIKAFY